MLKYISAEKISLRIDLLRALADTPGHEFIYEQVSSTDRNRDKRNINLFGTKADPKETETDKRQTVETKTAYRLTYSEPSLTPTDSSSFRNR